MRWRATLAGIVGALSCLGPLASPPVQADQPAALGCVADAELKIGDYGTSVVCLQYALGMIGLSDRPINGIYDEATSHLVSWFQATHPPLRVDGRAGAQTLAALGIWSGKTMDGATEEQCTADATIVPGDTSQSVRCLQDALAELGLYEGKLTGVSDSGTVEALKRYQASTRPLQPDGIAGPQTLAVLGIWSGRAGLSSVNGTVVFSNADAPPAGSIPIGPVPGGPWPAPIQPLTNWALTTDGIPVYGNRTPCTRAQADVIAYQFGKDGADIATQQWAVYIATREGGCRYQAVNQNAATQDDSHCTFQLNVLAGMFAPTGELGRLGWTAENVKVSLDNCADAASDLWVYCGRGPWTPPYSCRPPWKDSAPAAVISPDGDG